METNLGMDRIQERPIEQMIARWKRYVELREGMEPFSMFYVAGSEQKQGEAINYLAQQLDIGEEDRIAVDADPERRDLVVELQNLAGRVRSLKGKRVLIIAKGFEKRFAGKDERYRLTMFSRLGHDWDQDVVEDASNRELGKLYNSMGKHLVIVTTIGFSSGQEVYEEAVRSAVVSGFKTGIVELGEPRNL